MKKIFNLAAVLAILFLGVIYIHAQNPVSGFVFFNDNLQPVSSGYVNAYDASNLNLIATTNINSDGSFLFNSLPGIQIDVIGFPDSEPYHCTCPEP